MTGIILEGPNGAGKTVLAEQLSHILRLPVFRYPRPKTAADVAKCKLAFRKHDERSIHDRCAYISDWIYHDIPGTSFEFPDRFLKGYVIVHVTAPLSMLVQARPDADPARLLQLQNLYDTELPAIAGAFDAADYMVYDWNSGLTAGAVAARILLSY